jgi:hypothetical protein
MTDEGAKLLAELRELRSENDLQLAGLRSDLDAGFRQMDAGFRQMNGHLVVIIRKLELLQRQVTGLSSVHRRTLG